MDASSWYLRRFARRAIEAYPSIKRMASSITGRRRMGSPATVNSYIPGVMKFVDFVGYDNPEEALAAIKSGKVNVEDSLNRQDSGFIDTMLDRYANKTVNTYVFGVKKWLEANGVKVDLSKVEMPTTTVTRNKDRAPTQEELRKILHYCTQLKDRVVIHILTSSGLRIGTLLSLKWGDVDFNYPDVARITVRRAPGRKFSRRSSRGGDSNLYVTWITPEAKELLLEYKRYREQRGETITPESPLIEDGAGGHMTVSSYERRWHRILEKAGLNERSHRHYVLHIHTLRKYFRSRCVGVDQSYREHWMGHKGGYLDESYFKAEEQMHLAEYRKAIPYLSIHASEAQEEERRKRALLDFARFQGWSDERIQKLAEILQRARTVDEAAEEFRSLLNANENGVHRIAEGVRELERLLNEGWELVRELNGDRFLMRRNYA
ncbi:MAG: hypothetical protein DRI26_03590 [Chloroflexi bacterium]|nr:MAG: hypothetical protein DRI26_03590 [Chloroflexota bacterium]